MSSLKQRRALKRADQPKLGERARLLPGDVLAEIDDLAAGRRVEAADDVEGRGLAGAVRPDQAMNRTRIDIEAEIVDGDDAAEGSRQIANLENRLRRLGLLATVRTSRRKRTQDGMTTANVT